MPTIAQDKTLRIDKLVLGPFGTSTYIVTCLKTNASVVIDAPADAEKIIEALKGTTPRYILLTHNHIDHIGALAELHSVIKVPLAAHILDSGNLSVKPEISLKDGDSLKVGELKFDVLHTPGHTPGSLCFKAGRHLLSGDTLFTGGPGRTRTPADFRQIMESLTHTALHPARDRRHALHNRRSADGVQPLQDGQERRVRAGQRSPSRAADAGTRERG